MKMKHVFLETEIIRDAGDYEIVITQKPSHWLGFNVYRVIVSLENGTRVYNRDGYKSSPDPVEDGPTTCRMKQL